jgi:hypothetical protein
MAYQPYQPYQAYGRGRDYGQPIYPLERPDRTVMDGIRALGSVTLKPIKWALEILDTPGQLLRGTLVGEPGVIKHLVPFNESIFENVPDVSGRDVLESLGITDPENRPEGFDIPSFLAEIALDPLMYVGVGALTKAGKVAKSVAAVERQNSAIVEFMSALAKQGTNAEDMKILDNLYKENIKRIEAIQKGVQPVANQRALVNLPFGVAEWGKFELDLMSKLPDPVLKIGAKLKDKFVALPEEKEIYDLAKMLEQRSVRVRDEILRKNKAEFAKFGIDVNNPELIKYFERAFPGYEDLYQQTQNILNRIDDMMAIPGKTLMEIVKETRDPEVIKFIKEHDELRKAFRKNDYITAGNITDTYYKTLQHNLDWIKMKEAEWGEGVLAHLDIIRQGFKDDLAKNIAMGLPEDHLHDDWLAYIHHTITPEAYQFLERLDPKKQKSYWKFIKDLPMRRMLRRSTKGMDVVEIDAWARKELGYKGKQPFMVQNIWDAAARRGALASQSFYQRAYYDAIWNKLGEKIPKDLVDNTTHQSLKSWLIENNASGWGFAEWGVRPKGKKAVREWKKKMSQALEEQGYDDLYIRRDVLKDAGKPFTKLASGGDWKWFLDGVDKVTKYYRGLAIALWPSHYNRNIIGNLWNSTVLGPVKSFSVYGEAYKLQRKLAHDLNGTGLFKMTDAERKIINEAIDYGIIKRNTLSDLQEYYMFEGAAPANFFSDPIGAIQDKMSKKVPFIDAAKPFDISMRRFIPTGYQFGIMTENNARLAHFLYLRKQGHTAMEAAASVRKYLFNYNELTEFERTWMRRLAFFYTFTRKNTPLMIENLMRPGSNIFRHAIGQEQEGQPKWVRDAGIITLDAGDESGLLKTLDMGLPIQDFINPNLLSRLNPIIRTPMEIMAGQDFFTGRPLEELTRAPAPLAWLGDLLGADNLVMRELGYKETTYPSGHVEKTADPLLNFMSRSLPGSRLLNFDPSPTDSTILNLLDQFGIKIRQRPVTERGLNFNKLRDVIEVLENQGRLKKYSIYYPTDKTDKGARAVAQRLR